jgi:serine/threonine-protein kinase
VERLKSEAKLLASLDHPNIVRAMDAGEANGFPYVVMEYVEGETLRERMQREHRLPEMEALKITRGLADALERARRMGVVHRDVKPGNIMVLSDGRVKLMDFGIARLNENAVKTQTGTLLGSPQYMSPEQIGGGGVDARSDVFSLGVVLYEMLTGVKPFAGEDVTTLLFSIANMAAKPPRHVAPHLPPVIDYIIARALKKNPDERYQNAAELAADLHECAAEVAEAEAAARAKSNTDTATVPNNAAPPEVGAQPSQSSRPLPLSEEQVELRPSPRFDSVEGLARLAVLPKNSEETRSRAGWTVKMPKLQRRAARGRWALAGVYAIAALLAVAIILI